MDKEKLAPVIGRITSGIYIGTGMLACTRVGMLCSFVEQASFDPPMLTMAIAPDRRLAQALMENQRIAVNILGIKNQELMRAFANPNNEYPFEDIRLLESDYDLPIFEDALGYLVCEHRDEMQAGDHRVYLLEIIDGEFLAKDSEPMVRVRRNGFCY